jgi:hypothetical protein
MPIWVNSGGPWIGKCWKTTFHQQKGFSNNEGYGLYIPC